LALSSSREKWLTQKKDRRVGNPKIVIPIKKRMVLRKQVSQKGKPATIELYNPIKSENIFDFFVHFDGKHHRMSACLNL